MRMDSSKPVLTVGFEGETLGALRDRFNVQCVISEALQPPLIGMLCIACR